MARQFPAILHGSLVFAAPLLAVILAGCRPVVALTVVGLLAFWVVCLFARPWAQK
jgi:hypothetical protein